MFETTSPCLKLPPHRQSLQSRQCLRRESGPGARGLLLFAVLTLKVLTVMVLTGMVLTGMTPAALAVQDSQGLDARLSLAGGETAACGKTLSLELRLSNIDSKPIDLQSLTVATPEIIGHPSALVDPKPAGGQEGEDDPEVEPWPVVAWPLTEPSRMTWSQEPALPQEVTQSEEPTVFPLLLVMPADDGIYKEAVRADWTYKMASPVVEGFQGEEEAWLYYEVQGDCLQVLDVQQVADAADAKESYTLFDLEPVLIDSSSGVADLFDDEPLMSEAKTIHTIPSHRVRYYNDDEPSEDGQILDLQYCLQVRYTDHFKSCPSDPTGMLWWQPYCDQRKVPLLGLEVTLLDRDANSGDDVIGTWALHYDGLDHFACIDFEWDQRERGEEYPDVYPKTQLDVHDTEFGNTKEAHLCRFNEEPREECVDKYNYDWRGYYTPNLDEGTVPTRSFSFGVKDGVWNRRAMSMAALQKSLRGLLGQPWWTEDLNVWWNGDFSLTDGIDPWPKAIDDNWMILTHADYRRWTTPGHEAGHCLHMQLFEETGLTGTACPGPHYVDVPNNESCATREGWAQFFTTLMWFTGPDAKTAGRPEYGGYEVERGTPISSSCHDNAMTEIHVARTFWDVYDAQIDGSDIGSGGTPRSRLFQIWDRFPAGTDNQERREPGDDGVNLWDYHFHSTFDPTTMLQLEDAMAQNDTDCQSMN